LIYSKREWEGIFEAKEGFLKVNELLDKFEFFLIGRSQGRVWETVGFPIY